MQRKAGVEVQVLGADELRRRYPSFRFAGVDCGALSLADGEIDHHAALMRFCGAAEGLGVAYVNDRVVGLNLSGTMVSAAYLESGDLQRVDTLVNAANCWAQEICAMIGVPVPIEPMGCQQFHYGTREPVEPIPAMRRRGAPGVRRLQDGYLSGYTNREQPRDFNWDVEYAKFEDVLWPQLAEQSMAFEAIKLNGGFRSIDLARLSWRRFFDGQPLTRKA